MAHLFSGKIFLEERICIGDLVFRFGLGSTIGKVSSLKFCTNCFRIVSQIELVYLDFLLKVWHYLICEQLHVFKRLEFWKNRDA